MEKKLQRRHGFSLLVVLYAVIAEYVHGLYWDLYYDTKGLVPILFRTFVYRPICYFQRRNWRWQWHQYASYCSKRRQFYAKPETPFITDSKGWHRFVQGYLKDDGAVKMWQMEKERGW